jgi:hypothetical protein
MAPDSPLNPSETTRLWATDNDVSSDRHPPGNGTSCCLVQRRAHNPRRIIKGAAHPALVAVGLTAIATWRTRS